METILIIGVETVAGANIAASYSDRYHVVGVTSYEGIAIENCDIICIKKPNDETISQLISQVAADRLILCGSFCESHWLQPKRFNPGLKELQQVITWATAGEKANCHITLVSSDAIFTGPWMFHSEQSTEYCTTAKATFLRELERAVLKSSPDALIVRTNIFGWSPVASDVKIDNIDRLCQSLGIESTIDTTSYATPILATDFATILEAAHQNELTGVCHIAGSERTCQQIFIAELAKEFGIAQLATASFHALAQRPTGFAAGETSLHSIRIRKELNLPLPMLAEGIANLYQQSQTGYREQFGNVDVTILRAA